MMLVMMMLMVEIRHCLVPIDKAVLTYWRWYTNDIGDNGNNDKWVVSVSNNGGSTWQDIENTSISNASWIKKRFVINDYVDLTSNIIFKFIAEDIFNTGDAGSGGSLVEAALDDFIIEYISYGSGIVGDVNNDSLVNVSDIVTVVGWVLSSEYNYLADLNDDGLLNVSDIVVLVNLILQN